MARAILESLSIHPAIRDQVARHHADVVAQAVQAIGQYPVVVLGMGQNPFVKKARKALDAAGVAHHDIDHGSYVAEWRRRTALKMWSGWPTFPMVFVKGQLIGGADETKTLIASGELKRMLA